ncbi:MAG TPA: HAMP domain-containing sensor histidine kinase [Verrucomicrobiae bacterium]|nr:HAMP domain-containing sensor histidine kinase [Verrucomicrobiae bacterium]
MAAELPRENGDAALLRRTRLRLLAWSGGLTLLILVLLGAALYAAVSGSLASRGTDILAARASGLERLLQLPGQIPDRFVLGPGFGGEASGTLALIVRPDGGLVGPAELQSINGVPDPAGLSAARAGSVDVRQVEVSSIPVRVYSVAVTRPDGEYVVQVLGERSSEVQLLSTLLSVLAFGGLGALLLALAAGYVYAGRALIPVRSSMDRRDAALRRQREFTANASHELRTPLTVIRASVADLRRNRKQPVEKVGEALDDIDAEVSHLTALVEDLLLLARTDSGALALERVALDLADVAAEAAGPLTPVAAERGVQLEVDPRPAPVDADPVRLRQLVTILTDNALAHSPAGTTVTVRVRPEGGQAVLTVDDEGPGVREEDLPRLFERFWRADNAPAGGTGLGLSIAAWIVAAHGGTISAANRPEGGARFEVRLPTAAGDSPAA